MITIEHLSKSFSGNKVLDDLSLTIEQGEVVALIGASGAGKSTFLRSLNYLEEPDSGIITIDDFKVDFKTITKSRFWPYAESSLWCFSSSISLSVAQPLTMSKKV